MGKLPTPFFLSSKCLKICLILLNPVAEFLCLSVEYSEKGRTTESKQEMWSRLLFGVGKLSANGWRYQSKSGPA